MSNVEIALYLNLPTGAIEGLVKTNRLRRTIHCPYRCLDALSWSSVYDVLEYAMTCGRLNVKFSGEEAKAWVIALAEADEMGDFERESFDGQTKTLAEMVTTDGTLTLDAKTVLLAELVLKARQCLLEICADTDVNMV